MYLSEQGQAFVKFVYELQARWAFQSVLILKAIPGRMDMHFRTNIPLFCRFADFVEGSFHLTPNEVSVHEQEYGLGSMFAQDEELSSEEEGSEYPSLTQNNFLT